MEILAQLQPWESRLSLGCVPAEEHRARRRAPARTLQRPFKIGGPRRARGAPGQVNFFPGLRGLRWPVGSIAATDFCPGAADKRRQRTASDEFRVAIAGTLSWSASEPSSLIGDLATGFPKMFVRNDPPNRDETT